MSPKDFRKIYHPEPKISNSLVNCGWTHTRTHARTSVNLELTTRGGSAKNLTNRVIKYGINIRILKLGQDPLKLFVMTEM